MIGRADRRGRPGRIGQALAVALLGLGLGCGLAEVAVRLLDLAPRQRAAAGEPAAEEPGWDRPLANKVLHPFLGYSRRPGARRGQFDLENWRSLADEEFVVAMLGGSVAAGTARHGGETLAAELERRRPRLTGSVRVIELGLGGYKQPQQLNLLSLMLLLRVPLDAVVNLDGYNEIALSDHNARRKIHPLLPHYPQMALVFETGRGMTSAAQVELTAGILRSRSRARRLRGALDRRGWLRRSELVKALVGVAIVRAEDRAVADESRLGELARDEQAAAIANLPDDCLGKAFACQELIVDAWSHASRMMALLAEQHGLVYVHALQPSQYVEGSKTLTAEERRAAYDPARPWSRAAARGYAGLRQAGRRLAADGVAFHDLTMLFENRRDTIYADACCHPNKLGYRLIGKALAAAIDAALPPPAPGSGPAAAAAAGEATR